MFNITAHIETASSDCDGMHYASADYEMTDEERNGEFGDMEFFDRVATYLFSPFAISGRLCVSQDEDDMPVFEWTEDTEEGHKSITATFRKSH